MSKLGRMHPCQLDYCDRSLLLANQRVSRKRKTALKAWTELNRQLEAQHEDYVRSRTFFSPWTTDEFLLAVALSLAIGQLIGHCAATLHAWGIF